MSPTLPIVRIVLAGMEQEIAHAFSSYMHEQEDHTLRILQNAVKNFDYKGEICRLVNEQFPVLMNRALEDIIHSITYDPEFVQGIRGAMIRGLAGFDGKAPK